MISDAGQRREIGRFDLLWSAGLPTFRRGIIIACVQRTGSHAELIERLNVLQRYEMPEGLRCFRCRLVKLLGRVAISRGTQLVDPNKTLL